MPEEEFVTNYGQAVNTGLKNMRQNVQAECKKRAKGTWIIVILHGKLCLFLFHLTKLHGIYTEFWDSTETIPTVDDILAMFTMSPDELEKDDNKHMKDLCLWYFDRFLPVVAKKEFYGEDVHYYKHYMEKLNVNGVQKVAVTITCEAFGLTILQNCHKKWTNIFTLKKNDPKAKIPAKKEDANYSNYQAEWSDGKCGKIKFGGWKEGALEFMSEIEEKLVSIRTADAADDNKKAKYYMGVMRKEHNVDEPGPAAKKRRGKQALPVAPKQKKLKRRDE